MMFDKDWFFTNKQKPGGICSRNTTHKSDWNSSRAKNDDENIPV